MKKTVFKMMSCLLVTALIFGGCSQKGKKQNDDLGSDSESLFTPGTYQGIGSGYGGDVVVEVTVTADKIEKIIVIEHNESVGIGTTAVDQLPAVIVEKQSLVVDTISGCTASSQAIMVAVEDAIKVACKDMTKMYAVNELAKEEWDLIQKRTQVLVLGGGGSGLTAAIAASNAGADVVLIEKMSFLGGAASISGGQVNGGGSEYQKAHGISNDSAEAVAADLLAGGHNLNDKMLVDLYSREVGLTFDWLVNIIGMKFEENVVSAPEHRVDRIFIGEGKAAGMNGYLLKALEENHVDVILDARASRLLEENGRIVGASAVSTNSSLAYEVRADVVIVATGGYGNNKNLLPQSLQSILYYGSVSSTGDGLLILNDYQPKKQMMDYGKIYPNGIEVAPGLARSTVTASTTVFNQTGTILVNRAGKRLVNETGTYADIRTQMMAQKDQTLFLVMDQNAFDLFREKCKENNYATEAEIDSWLSKNGKETPVFTHGEALADAALAAGIDPLGLVGEVEAFNQGILTQQDKFGRVAAKKIASGPFYIVEQKPRFATTLGGLCINEQMQVLTENGGVIPGLLAAGEIIGGLHGDDSMPSVCVSWAFTSGRLAGESAVKHLSGEYQWSQAELLTEPVVEESEPQ